MPFAGTSSRRRRWALLLAAATAGMVLAASMVLYFRIEAYYLREPISPRTLERRLQHHQRWIGITTAGSFLVSWALASWAARRLFGPLEEAYRRESAFAADVAHELRTPLARMRGELETGGGKAVDSLLELLLRAPGEVLPRSVIAQKLWDDAFESFSNVIDVHVRRLRQKVGEPALIQTVKGVGYALRRA